MSEPSRLPSTVVRHLPSHAADLVAGLALVAALLVLGVGDRTVTPATVVLLGALALGVRGVAGLAVAWVVDNW